MQILLTIGISLLTAIGSLVGVYKYLPLNWIEPVGEPVLGTTITTILSTDTLSASRTTINNNFTALNNSKFELTDWFSTTSARQITTLSSLATVGTITSGVWSGTALVFAKGGVASTSLSSNQVLLGDTTTGFKTVTGWEFQASILLLMVMEMLLLGQLAL